MPRRSAVAVADTRADVLETAVRRASFDGLEGLTIGRLAEEVAMSKSGLHGLFGSKEDLQVATFETAVALYAIASAASQAIQLDEPGASARARRCMLDVLGR